MMGGATADREIVVTRVIDAPRDVVFAAWTEREHVEKWWLPSGGTTHEWSAKPGGLWRYSAPGPDGAPYAFKVEFIEIARPSRLVYDHGTDAENAPAPVRAHVTFEEDGGRTKITLQLVFATAAAREEAMKYGALGGAKAALRALAGHVAKL